ncbi:hypothetical protein KM800_09250 [Clostridium tyrobutyricum]|uniref:hypothetical protein n=1 Tax=Clostridium tyrobutyricum TaxID=1519 RepID=UPI001C38DBC3|nr:hypothetical protein [Clostridium tyrobutyricum]MBV4419514.1 hypothetical protein [Clostridium tyrobutyricum]
MNIKEVDHIASLRIMNLYRPLGKFISKDGGLWIAIDNCTGKVITREFRNKEDCILFLNKDNF